MALCCPWLYIHGVIVFLLTGGEILDDNGKQALKEFIHSAGGLVTIHTGCYTVQEWPWFNHLTGAGFIGHPPLQQGKLIIEDNTHFSTNFTDDTVIYGQKNGTALIAIQGQMFMF